MKRHLTAAGIERIKPPKQGITEIFDLGYPGLALRVGHGGAKSFEVFYRDSRKKLVRKRMGRWPEVTLAQARDQWRKTREAIARGEVPHHDGTSSAPLFEVVVEDWLKRDQAKNKPISFYQVSRAVEADLLPAWRGRPIDKITKADIIALLNSIADRAPAMAKRMQSSIHRLFAWCIERDIISVNPTAGMPRLAGIKSRERVLSDAELASVWKATPSIGVFGAVTRLLILTGARREEIGQLRWSEIDGDTITLEGSRTKNGEAHLIPLSEPAKALLASMPRIGNSDYVFTLDGKKPITAWAHIKTKLDEVAGVHEWVIHDLRRTVATGLQAQGTPLPVTEAILGHTAGSRAGIVGVYQRHNYRDEKRQALEAWAGHVMSLVM